MSNVKIVDETNFERFMAGPGALKVVRFWATWCAPCRMLGPIYQEVAAGMQELADFADVDVDKAPVLAGQFGIRSVPAVLFLKGNTVVREIVGLSQKEAYIRVLQDLAA